MRTETIKAEKTRFDTRLPKEQKELFEKAAQLGGYRSLTDFVISAVQEKAKQIIAEKEYLDLSQADAELFFEAITNYEKPNEELRNAADEYNKMLD